MNNNQKVRYFRDLHTKNKPLVLFNVWNVESAIALSNFIKIIPTSSYAMSNSYGYQDGENMPFEEIVAYAKEMQEENSLVSIDIESGYASSLKELERNIRVLMENGVIGINIEDKIKNSNNLFDTNEQCERITCIKNIREKIGMDLFINVRTDIYFLEDQSQTNLSQECLQQALNRIKAYGNAGADGVFLPGLINKDHIRLLTENTQVPINMMLDIRKDNILDYLDLGVSRFTFGPSLYLSYYQDNTEISPYLNKIVNEYLDLANNHKIELGLKLRGMNDIR